MKFELPVGQEALLSERERLEGLLAASEDWRALVQLKSRQERGEGLSAVNAARLEALLVDALTENPVYGRYRAVSDALGGTASKGSPISIGSHGVAEQSVDDLTRIRGIDPETARRLRGLGVWTYSQVAEWTSMDIHRVATELGIGKLIHSQNWIEQAALLALANPRADAAKKQSPVAAASPKSGQQFVQPIVLPKQEPLPVPPVAARAALIEAVMRGAPVASPAPAPPQQLRPAEPTPPAQVAPPVSTAASRPEPVSVTPPPRNPPAALRVVTLSPEPVSPEPVSVAAPIVPVAAELPLAPPPRPFVVTRDSLPASQPTSPLATPPVVVNPPIVNAPAINLVTKPAASFAPPLPPALQATSGTAAAVPAMTITEAIAYAAAAARSSQRPSADTPAMPPVSTVPVSSGTNGAHRLVSEAPKSLAEPPPIPSMIRVAGPPPNIPPPLPADFKPAELKAEEPAPKPRQVKFDTPRALTIDRDREDIGGFNANVEEASVEIVRRTVAAAPIPPKAALAAAVAAAQAAQPADAPRLATPIGRFLKALTGA